MGKKGKVNKLAKMSDEERARYLQHRADLEEEARRRKRELIARFIKNKLDKEEAFSKINTAKLNEAWRFILRRIKCKQMALDIQGMMATFNFMMERKNRLITCLMTAIDDSDDQHRRAFQAHTENISHFLCIGSQRLDKLQDEYEKQKNILLENWEKQEIEITDNQDQAEFNLTLIMYIQDRDFKCYKQLKELERATAKNDAKLEHEEEMRGLRRPKEWEIEKYWTNLREVYGSYMDQHSPIMGHYQLLREKDEFYQRDIARNERHLQQATKIVTILQREYLRTTSSMASKIQRMCDRKEDLAKRYTVLKKQSKIDRSRSNEQLVVLVEASQTVTEKLEAAVKKLQKIQQLADICSKFEKLTDADVITNVAENDRAVLFENLNDAMVEECKENSKMDKFLFKMNHVKVQTMCLRAEKSKLTRENLQLKHYIRKYLTELALKNEQDRPISVRLQSENIERLKINRPVTCIEGALSNAVMHERRMKIFDKRNKDCAVRAYPRVQNWMS